LELKNIIAEMKKITGGSQNRFEIVEERINLKIIQLRLLILLKSKKKE
jgi:hypothetical protein